MQCRHALHIHITRQFGFLYVVVQLHFHCKYGFLPISTFKSDYLARTQPLETYIMEWGRSESFYCFQSHPI